MTTEKETQAENAKPAPREVRVVVDTSPNANLLDTARFEHAQRIASSIAYSPLIPEHLRRNKHRDFTVQEIQANVMLVVSQALLWDVHPSAIIGETYVVGGRLGYQGKLVAALINAKANLKERLSKTFEGKPGTDDFTIVITGTFRGEETPRETRMSVGEAKTENQMWKKNPRLKLWYSGVVQWAREYAPELILGIVTDDDAERMEAWKSEAPATPQGLAQSAGKPAGVPLKTSKPVFVPETLEEPEKVTAGRVARKKATPAKVVDAEQVEKDQQQAEDDADAEAREAKINPPVTEGEDEFPWDKEGA